jgi:diguanylate cyclase (GGDEF)-like protein
MSRQRFRRRGWSLAARLLLVALVPTAFMVNLAADDIGEAQATVAAADSIADQVSLERDVARVTAPAYIEYLTHVGLATVDTAGLDRAMVADIIGIDYEQLYTENRSVLDTQIDGLVRDFGDLLLDDGATLGSELAPIRLELGRVRTAIESHRGEPEAVRVLFDDLDALLVRAVADKRSSVDAESIPGELERFRAQSSGLSWVLRTAGTLGVSVLDSVMAEGVDVVPVVSSLAAHAQARREFATMLPADVAASFEAVVDSGPDVLAELPTAPVVDDGIDPAGIQARAARVVGQLQYIGALGSWADGYFDSVAARSVAVSADARSSRSDILWSVAAALVAGLFVIVLLSRSLLRPLGALSRRAREISEGDLSQEPLRESGPHDLRTLIRTVNGMQQTLQLFERQSGALAVGHLDDPSLAAAAPGTLGESIRSSVAQLTEVTARLQVSEARSLAIVSHAAVAIWTVDESGVIVSANAAAEAALLLSADKQVGRDLELLLGTLRGESTVVRRDGSKLVLDVDNSVVETSGTWLRTVIAEDITERQEFARRLAHQARHDELTGLPNRFAILERLAELTEGGRRAAVLFVDVDGFKSVNDSQGHASGDVVLAEIASRLRSEVRAGAMVARLGGDEFLVVAEGMVDEQAAVKLGRRLIERIEQPYQVGDSLFVISASVGVASIVRGDQPLDVIHRADSAVYRAKDRGRGRVEVYSEVFQARIEQRAELELALRDAVAHGELQMFLQPIFDIASGEPCGAEALARWYRPDVGFVPPNEFIAIAEASPLIFELTRWMLVQACRRAASWRRFDPACKLRIAVNLSGRHLIDGDLIGDLTEVLRETGADPTMLELELTETQLLADLDAARKVLETVRSMGITVAVDDFGTGSSSMAYLRQLPVDVIKVDRSFVSGTGRDGFDSTAIDAMVNFGRVLGVVVVAEGVETVSQLKHVSERGCTRAQGFLLGIPLPADEADLVLGLATAPPQKPTSDVPIGATISPASAGGSRDRLAGFVALGSSRRN